MTDYPARNENRLTKGELAPGEITLPRPGRIATIVAIVFVFALIVLGMAGYVEKWLWMRQLDYIGIFWTVLSVECAMGVLAFAVVFGFLWLNLRRAAKGTAASLRAARPRGAASSTANDTDTEGLGLGETGEPNAPLARAVGGGAMLATIAKLISVPVHLRCETTHKPASQSIPADPASGPLALRHPNGACMKPENEILDPYGEPTDKAAAELVVVRRVKAGTGARLLGMAMVLVLALGLGFIFVRFQ